MAKQHDRNYTKQERRRIDLIRNAKQFVKSSCFWADGSSWLEWYDFQDDFSFNFTPDISSQKNWKSDVKSGEIWGRNRATMDKLIGLTPKAVFSSPTGSEAFVKFCELVTDEFFGGVRFKQAQQEAIDYMGRNGIGVLKLDWVRKTSKKKYMIVDPKNMTDKQKKENEEGKQIFKEMEVIDVEGNEVLCVDPRDIAFSPGSEFTHGGGFKGLRHYVLTDRITQSQFENSFKKDKRFKNTDQVVSRKDATVKASSESSLYVQKKDPSDNYVYVDYMYGVEDDNYFIVANDVPIYDSPLPYNHKVSNVVILRPIKLPKSMNGVSLADQLAANVTAQEKLFNSFLDSTFLVANSPVLIDKQQFPEISKYLKEIGPGANIPANDPQGATHVMTMARVPVEALQSMDVLQKQATVISRQDPSNLGVLRKDVSATANVIQQQMHEAYLNGITETLKISYADLAKMVVFNTAQFAKETRKKSYLTDTMEVEMLDTNYKIKISDKEVIWDRDSGNLIVEPKPGHISYLEIVPELFMRTDPKTKKKYVIGFDEVDVTIDARSIDVSNEALRDQAVDTTLSSFAPFIVDDSDPAKVAAHPAPYIRGARLIEWAFEQKRLPKDILIDKTANFVNDIKDAQQQNAEMKKGNYVLAKAGQSDEHLAEHDRFIEAVTAVKVDVEARIEAEGATKGYFERIMDISNILGMAIEHRRIDALPASSAAQSIKEQAMPAPGGATMMGGVNVDNGNPAVPDMMSTMGMPSGQLGGIPMGMPPMGAPPMGGGMM